jgi:hypothetical protein
MTEKIAPEERVGREGRGAMARAEWAVIEAACALFEGDKLVMSGLFALGPLRTAVRALQATPRFAERVQLRQYHADWRSRRNRKAKP